MDNMDKACIIPEIIDKLPQQKLQVIFENDVAVEFGNELAPTQVKHEPKVHWEAEPDSYYTLCMVDPDAPCRLNPELREWHHWLVGNIPGNDVEKGDILSEYIGAAPPAGTGLHRYVFLVFKQKEKIEFTQDHLSSTSSDRRAHFSVRKFVFRNKLGDLVAGNFFQAQWDNYVPLLSQQLGMLPESI